MGHFFAVGVLLLFLFSVKMCIFKNKVKYKQFLKKIREKFKNVQKIGEKKKHSKLEEIEKHSKMKEIQKHKNGRN